MGDNVAIDTAEICATVLYDICSSATDDAGCAEKNKAIEDLCAEIERLRADDKRLRGDLHRKLGNQIGPEIFKAKHLLCSSCSGKGTGLTCSECDMDVVNERDDLLRKIERLRELSARRGEYVELLEAELGEINFLATNHGWTSSRYEDGVRIRAQIDAALHKNDSGTGGGGDG